MILLSGDVGSGKTIVSLLAAAAAIDSGTQVALMVPSVLVAVQHAERFHKLLAPLGIRVGLLTGDSGSKELYEHIASGEVDLLVGTQALFTRNIEFRKLGLMIIDEQHRFGVKQRFAVPEREGSHVLLLSATPIPRTTALALYGDLDMSVMKGFPSKMAGTRTYLRPESGREDVWNFIEQRIEEGERAIVVHPRIEGKNFSSAKFGFSILENRFKNRVAILHGAMSNDEKQSVFSSFRSGVKPILATTSLVEIGIDVPEATVLLVESAENFGLAQLHQLRGRVGRADKPGWCILLTDKPKGSTSYERLHKFSRIDNGFEIANLDILDRGEGEILGLDQAGRPNFIFADPLRMKNLLEKAKTTAKEIISEDPQLLSENYELLRKVLNYMYSNESFIDSAV